jgi:hypothetical protein
VSASFFHHIFASQDQIHVTRFVDIGHVEVFVVVVGGVTLDAEVVDQFSVLFGLGFSPFKVGAVELYALISHLGNGAHRAFQIFR